VRYFGPRPLIEDDSVRSSSTTLLNADVGYKLRDDLRLGVEVFNLLDSEDSDATSSISTPPGSQGSPPRVWTTSISIPSSRARRASP